MIKKIEQISRYSKNVNLLYVEDDPIARENILEFLESMFDNIIIATNGQEGLDKFQENNIDLIITDINMPKLNGMEMIEEIKKINNNVYVIILSQHNETKLLLQSIENNIDGYILKPIKYEQLIDSIEKVLKKFKFEYEYKNQRYSLEQYLNLIDEGTNISKTDPAGIITHVSDIFCKISGYPKNELIGKTHAMVKHEDNPPELYENLWRTIKIKKEAWEGVVKNKAKNGEAYYIKMIVTPIFDLSNNIIEYISTKNIIDKIIDDKSELFKKIEVSDLSILIQIQINEFEMFENFYNGITINQIEKSFSHHLKYYLPKEYIFKNIYSLGSGRFALLTSFSSFNKANVNLEEYLNQFVLNVKESILKFDGMEFDLHISLSYSIGQHMIYEDSKTGLENALKNREKVTFSNDLSIVVTEEAKQNLEMIKTVKIALENYNIVSYFQPIINNKTKKIEKYESLVRLIDEDGKIISPFSFMNISKKSNYYTRITERVLENSFKILHTISTKISINISASDIENELTVQRIYALLNEYKEDNHRIIFELLEDEDVEDFKSIKKFIKNVKDRGCQIAIDDFGAGYSNFERLLDFEPNILKIDGSLVKNIENDAISRNMVESIVLFAKKQNIETIAEYVENESIFNLLNEMGVDYSQGYYFGKPEKIES